MVRDFAVKELMRSNHKAGLLLNDICYGHGFVLHENAMVPTGGCKKKVATLNEGTVKNGDGLNQFKKTCELKEGPTFIRHRKIFNLMPNIPITPIQRLKN